MLQKFSSTKRINVPTNFTLSYIGNKHKGQNDCRINNFVLDNQHK
ncbi:hypothetical protein BVRB_6g145430 [Beta vulgaris subsp. vulgaris]|nr:hypothetical protein BVRB_6g145430 [Beta vulgaris subsp. vulgaris]